MKNILPAILIVTAVLLSAPAAAGSTEKCVDDVCAGVYKGDSSTCAGVSVAMDSWTGACEDDGVVSVVKCQRVCTIYSVETNKVTDRLP